MPWRGPLAAAVLLAATVACGSTPIPSTSPETISTIVAATMGAITPAATLTPLPPTIAPAAIASPTSPAVSSALPTLPSVIYTPVPPDATRVRFLTDATFGQVSGSVQPGGSTSFVVQAAQGQVLIAEVESVHDDVTLSVMTQGGTTMLNASSHLFNWRGALPQTEDYYLTVHGGSQGGSYTLLLTIPSRIRFKEGSTTTKVRGTTVGGYVVSYTIFAIKDQLMKVDMSTVSGEAALSLEGFTDGQTYISGDSERMSFNFRLPATQDYVLRVIPRDAAVLDFGMQIDIQ